MDVKTFQQITGLKPDGISGPKTKAKAEEVQKLTEIVLGKSDIVTNLQSDNARFQDKINQIKKIVG